jgi:hypothetical protein
MANDIISADPIVELLLSGKAASVDEAEELYLDASISEVLRLVKSDLTDAEFRSHPLIQLLMSRGSRGREDSPW